MQLFPSELYGRSLQTTGPFSLSRSRWRASPGTSSRQPSSTVKTRSWSMQRTSHIFPLGLWAATSQGIPSFATICKEAQFPLIFQALLHPTMSITQTSPFRCNAHLRCLRTSPRISLCAPWEQASCTSALRPPQWCCSRSTYLTSLWAWQAQALSGLSQDK